LPSTLGNFFLLK